MRWRAALVVVTAVACESREEQPPRPPPPPAPTPVAPAVAPLVSPGAPPQLAPLPGSLAAPTAGQFRFPYYDVDIKLPGSARAELHGHNAVTFDRGCTLVIDHYTHNAPQQVGTLGLWCQASGRDQEDRRRTDCDRPCKTLVAVPGSTAVEPYPSAPPVIELVTRPVAGDRISRGAYVWSDGTVQFFGPTCTRWRGRRGTLAPERVKEIVTALERSGALGTPSTRSCDEGIYAKIVVRARGEEQPPFSAACTSDGSPLPREIAGVAAALGPNPCDVAPPPRTPLPAAPPAALVDAAAPFPTEAPAISFEYFGGGMSNPSEHGLDVWLDGTVRFTGFNCKAPRRATLPRERVAVLLAALDQRAMLDAGITMDSVTACCDCERSSLELRLGAKHARLIKPGCSYSATNGFTEAHALVAHVVGPNPCGASPPSPTKQALP